jgi:hypothetical protein
MTDIYNQSVSQWFLLFVWLLQFIPYYVGLQHALQHADEFHDELEDRMDDYERDDRVRNLVRQLERSDEFWQNYRWRLQNQSLLLKELFLIEPIHSVIIDYLRLL